VNSSNALEERRALSRADRLSRIPWNRTRLVVPDVELPAASVSGPAVASARIFVFSSNNAGVCMDVECAAAYSGINLLIPVIAVVIDLGGLSGGEYHRRARRGS
jgi:hypothetical protein